ncbi:MAG: sensor domain-containing diguanylate cyclase [Fervidobacterium sp.]|uniref:sensor domain-containing diguanylate cyclase n=1 Tax=Fervidobacterium sp. TaxID=1871331 RepID=UPI00404A5291
MRSKSWVYFLLLGIITFSLFIFLRIYFENEDKSFRGLFQKIIETQAMEISRAYFQWDDMYNAVSKQDYESIEKLEKQMKKDYPFIVDVSFEKSYPPDEFYSIHSEGKLLVVEYKIMDSFGEKYLPNYKAKLLIDVSTILRDFQIENRRITTEIGNFVRDLAYGLKYERLLSVTEIPIVMSFILLLLIAITILYEMYVRRELDVEATLNKALNSVIQLSQDMLKGSIKPSYQLILEKAIEIIPGAQAGSVLVKEGDRYKFSACVGYNFEELKRVWFLPEELAQSMDPKVKIITHIQGFDSEKLKDERFQILDNYGRIKEIKAMLSVPIIVNNEIAAFLNIDNFEKVNAFNDFSVRIAELFATQIGVVFERLKLEEELLKQKNMLEFLSTRDALTQLPNRRALEIEAERMMNLTKREGKNICVVYVDLQKFKTVNDSFGHRVGDYLLKVVSERLQKVVRKSDFVARIGGDEFVFLLYDCKEYLQFVERTLNEVEKDIVWESHVFRVSANFGIAIYPQDGTDFGDLLIKADMAMYYAKNTGKSYHLASQLSIDNIE